MKPVLLLLLALSLDAASVEQLFAVQSVTVTKERTAPGKTYYGYSAADESRIVAVTPRFGGYVTKLFADTTYVYVKKGAPLVQVYSPEVLQAKEEYRNALAYDKRHGNATMVQSAKNKLELLGVSYDEIDAIAKGRTFENDTRIHAPFTGYIFAKNVKKGSAFKAATQLFEIVNTDTLWIDAAIYQKDIADLNGFESFEIRAEGDTAWHKAKKEILLPKMENAKSTATLRLSINNASHALLPGMYCEVRASKAAVERLIIPRSAAIRKYNRWYVFMEGEYEGEYEPLEVSLRALDDERYEVLSGLEEGDVVVNNALFMIDSDAQINGLY